MTYKLSSCITFVSETQKMKNVCLKKKNLINVCVCVLHKNTLLTKMWQQENNRETMH